MLITCGAFTLEGEFLELPVAAFADSSLESADQADSSQELTCVDVDTFIANCSRILDACQQGTLRPGFGIAPYFARIEGHLALLESFD